MKTAPIIDPGTTMMGTDANFGFIPSTIKSVLNGEVLKIYVDR